MKASLLEPTEKRPVGSGFPPVSSGADVTVFLSADLGDVVLGLGVSIGVDVSGPGVVPAKHSVTDC